MQSTIDTDQIAQSLVEADAIETVNGYAAGGLEYDGFKVTDLRLFAQSFIAEVTGSETEDTEQINRVIAAVQESMNLDSQMLFWTGAREYHSDDLTFVAAAFAAL